VIVMVRLAGPDLLSFDSWLCSALLEFNVIVTLLNATRLRSP